MSYLRKKKSSIYIEEVPKIIGGHRIENQDIKPRTGTSDILTFLEVEDLANLCHQTLTQSYIND